MSLGKDVSADHKNLFSMEEEEETHISERLRVLAIDDNVVCLKVLVVELEKCGYHVTATTKASEAIEMLRKNKDLFDIVITDVMRSDMDGFMLLKIISHEMDIPVIMASANSDVKIVYKGVVDGARDFLVKPVRLEVLRNIWQHVVRKTLHNPKPSILEDDEPRNTLHSKRHERSTEELTGQRKSRVVWTDELHRKFTYAVQLLGDGAVPKKIHEIMNEPQVSRESVASHLQKYRNSMKKENVNMSQESNKHLLTNGMQHLANSTIQASAKEYGLLTLNRCNSYSEYGPSSYPSQNPLYLPRKGHGLQLQQNPVPSQYVDQMRETMAVQALKNVTRGQILGVDPPSRSQLNAIPHRRNLADHDYMQIPSAPVNIVPRHPGPFTTMRVGNPVPPYGPIHGFASFSYPCRGFNVVAGAYQKHEDAANQTIISSRPNSLVGQISSSSAGYHDEKRLVTFGGEDGFNSIGEPAGSQVGMQGQVNGSAGNDQIRQMQFDVNGLEKESNGHNRNNTCLDGDLVALFLSDPPPEI